MKTFKLVIAGGGSTYTPGIVKSLLVQKDRFKLNELVLYDNNAERQEAVGVIVRHVVEMFDPELKLTLTTDPEVAMTDADFIFAQMRVGLYAMREQDEKIPLKYGVVGQETCGPGGLAYGLRTIYPMVELIDYCEKYAKPTYWIVNYSNPAAIVAKATFRLRPKARILNICDMPVAIERNMAEILECDRHDLEVDYFGLNHFGWFTKVRLNGEDVTEKLKSYVAEHGYMPQNAKSDVLHSDPSWLHTYANAKNICSAFHDYLPNTYMQYYLLGDEVVKSSDPNHTRANEVINGREKNVFGAARAITASGEFHGDEFSIDNHASFIVDLARAIAYNTHERMLCIVENKGAISNFDPHAMVEVPCLVGNDGPEPLCQGEIPTFQLGMMNQQVAVEKLVVEAYCEHSYQKLWQALTLSKTVPSAKVAKEILAAKGITLDIQEYDDYVIPNQIVEDGQVDTNYFQHQPYLDNFNEEKGTHLVTVAGIHVEPMGIYGGKQDSLAPIEG